MILMLVFFTTTPGHGLSEGLRGWWTNLFVQLVPYVCVCVCICFVLFLVFFRFVDMYAANDELFFEDFAKAFSTLLELGTHDLAETTA